MKDASYRAFVLLSSLLIMLTGCERRDILDDYPVHGVRVKIDWNGVTDKLPEGMRIIFYPKDVEGRKVESYLSVAGGEVIKVPPGRYAVVVYNYDTETVRIKGEESYEMLQAYTEHCGLNIAGTEKMVWAPDALYVVNIDDLEIEDSKGVFLLEVKPKLVVETFSFEVKAEGLKNVGSMIGKVEGMADCYFLGRGKSMYDACAINFDLTKGDGVIQGRFTTFGKPGIVTTRAETEVIMSLMLIKVDNTVQEVKIDITTAITETPPPEGGGEDIPPVEIKLPPGEEIIVDDVAPPPGGGIGGDVGDWEDGGLVEL